MKQQRKKQKGITPINLDVCPLRRMEKLLKYSSVRETDFSVLVDRSKLQQALVHGHIVYTLPQPEGAYLVQGFLSLSEQLQIAQQALNQYVAKPYRTNLSGQKGLYDNESHSEPEKEEEELEPVVDNPLYRFDQRIRWANLGYNYDWTNRKYPDTKTPMPASVAGIATRANLLYSQIANIGKEYAAESAIVNYYKERDAMTSHLDDAQPDQSQPIFSVSLGLSCVFVIGGETKEMEPQALRLDSGDLFIMAGRSRRCYHGVPRVMAETFVADLSGIAEPIKQQPNSLQQTAAYLRTHRININTRQVHLAQQRQ